MAGNFTIDRESKNDYTASTVAYLNENYPNITGITFYEPDEDGDLVPYGDWRASTTAHIDIVADLSWDGGNVTYSAEIKERWGNYTSDFYGKDGQNKGWVYNIEKDGWLEKECSLGRIPIYVNLYPDGVIRVWNINKIDKSHHTTLPIKKIHTDPDSPRVEQERIELWNRDGKTYKRIKG